MVGRGGGGVGMVRDVTTNSFQMAGPCGAVCSAFDLRARGPGLNTWSGHMLWFLLPLI